MKKCVWLSIMVTFFLTLFDFSSVGAYTQIKKVKKEKKGKTAISLRLGYGFSTVGEKDSSYSDYDNYGNKRILLEVDNSFTLVSSDKGRVPFSLDLPATFGLSYRFNTGKEIRMFSESTWVYNAYQDSKFGEIMLDAPLQLSIKPKFINPYVYIGPSLSFFYSHNYFTENGISFLYGYNTGIGSKFIFDSFFGDIKLRYRYLMGKNWPIKNDFIENLSLRKKTITYAISAGYKWIEAGLKLEKSKTKQKPKYKGSWEWWWGEPLKEEWTDWTGWSKGEIVLFLGTRFEF